ncbi:MAG: methyl-accepting chemotaxis protein [Pseudomonadota bacterium]
MIQKTYKWIQGSLKVKILVSIAGTIALIVGIVSCIMISRYTGLLLKKVELFGLDLADNIYSLIENPMEKGNDEAVQQHIANIQIHTPNVSVYICDPDQTLIYASDRPRRLLKAQDIITNQEALTALENALNSGTPSPKRGFINITDKGNFLTTFILLKNHEACYHCHGSSRTTLGSLIVSQSISKDLLAIASSRNLSIMLALACVITAILLLNYLLTRLVSKPVRRLAEQTHRVAQGDFLGTVEVNTQDSVGKLAQNFNLMTKSIQDKMEYANSLRKGIAPPFFMVDLSMTITYINRAAATYAGYSNEDVEGKKKCWEVFQSNRCNGSCVLKECIETGKNVTQEYRLDITNRYGKTTPIMASAAALKDSSGKILGGFEIWRDITHDLESEQLLKESAANEERHRKYLEERVSSLLSIFDKAAAGDLSQQVKLTDRNDEMDRLSKKTNEMFLRIAQLINQAKLTALTVANGAQQIAAGSQDLALRTEEQAATVEETSATLQEISTSINSNANNTVRADNLAKEVVSLAREGEVILENTINAVTDVAVTSKRIEEIMDLVSEITFQTKLLALNAAVEAARAGEHGKGFSVVANEVRNLAKRSDEASKDIKTLVKETMMPKVDTAHQLVTKTGYSLRKIISDILSLSSAISEISIATQDESKGIEQINQAMIEIGSVVEQNASLVEELASASEHLKTKAETLKKQTGEFLLHQSVLDLSHQIEDNSSENIFVPVRKERRGKAIAHKSLKDELARKGKSRDGASYNKDIESDLEGFEEF